MRRTQDSALTGTIRSLPSLHQELTNLRSTTPVDTKRTAFERAVIGGQVVEYRLRPVRDGGLRVRVGPSGVEVLYPVGRPPQDVETFLQNNSAWLLNQQARVAPLRSLRRMRQRPVGEILLH